MEDDIDDISLKSQNSPVFGVQASNSFLLNTLVTGVRI